MGRAWRPGRPRIRLESPDPALMVTGSGSELTRLFKANFRVVKPMKPKASRDKSAETFMVGIGLRPPDTN